MKREYFGMLFILTFMGLYCIADYFLGTETVSDYLSLYIVIWVMIGYSVGQYSMKFPKAF